MPKLPPEAPAHPIMGQRWFEQQACALCGAEKEDKVAYHCDPCYSRIFPAIFDYDDD